jgi:hypothetical protein
MSNNIPFYPLLRRDVDIVIALDTSADIQTTPWFERTDGTNCILRKSKFQDMPNNEESLAGL